MSKVAIWMPAYNEERHLREAIDSVLGQTFTDWTLYISDNRSTDDCFSIIKEFALRDGRVKYSVTQEHLAGIPHMRLCWNNLNTFRYHDYSIQIGGHDFWPKHHLETLVKRMDAERTARKDSNQRIALIYTDTFQADEEGKIVGRYQDIMQLGQVSPMMIPQYVIAGVNSPQVFGLWNEAVRRQVPFRHASSGWDHQVVMEAALHGMILFEGATALTMRCPKAGDCTLERYGQRHLSAEQLASGTKDFFEQVEWCLRCVDKAVDTAPAAARPLYRALLANSMFSTYVAHRGLNLNIVPGGMKEFNENPIVRQLFANAAQTEQLLRELVFKCKS